ncbi:hypothetical protein GL218_06548 [Daldinia childiae]|uniref:uncharacterized protein n=1 Tax=Daldinia childiae TaxID=326645 RepID=UPI0014484C01|nr:uncharacterized protein GL218_06548 [Daldinia childiae]KAF3056594.1 hypothetical protein GL218_06548 [Daldinia childiae]
MPRDLKKGSSVKPISPDGDDVFAPSQGSRKGVGKSRKYSKKSAQDYDSDESDSDSEFYKPTQRELRDNGVLKYKPRAMDHLMVNVAGVSIKDESESDSDKVKKAKKAKKAMEEEANKQALERLERREAKAHREAMKQFAQAEDSEVERPSKKKKGSKHHSRATDSESELEKPAKKKGKSMWSKWM